MLNAFDKKKYLLEEEQDNKEPFDKRIKQIETIRKNRLIQLEKAKKIAQDNLEQSSKQLNQKRREISEQSLYYCLLEPIIEKKFLYLDANVVGLTRWVDEIKNIHVQIQQVYSTHQTYIDDWKFKHKELEQAKKECQEMLVQTEKLALLETLYNENGGI